MVVIRNRLQRNLGGDDENLEDFFTNNVVTVDDILTQNAINDTVNNLNDLSLVDELTRSPEADDDHDSLLEHQLAEAVVNQRTQRRKAKKAEKKATRPQQTWQCLGARGRSHHKHRRYEQADLLTRKYAAIFSDYDGDTLWAETEMALSIYDFIPRTVESAFARYMKERDTMKAWNDFIECTEDQQENLLNGKDANSGHNDAENDENRPPKSRKSKSKSKTDKRNRHPSYSAEECFMRLDNDLRTMLRKRRIPFGVLASIEESVTDFFNSSPMAEYKDRLPGFQRLLLHACCQYMDLNCQSFDEDGVRWSRVRNRRQVFIPPPVMLADYLKYRKNGQGRQRSASEHSPL